MKSFNEALVHKHIDHNKNRLQQWSIVKTRGGKYWCVLTDLEYIKQVCPKVKNGMLGASDISGGIVIYIEDGITWWNPLNSYNDMKFDGYNHYDIVEIWKYTGGSLVTNLSEFLKESNLKECTISHPKYKLI